MALVSDASSSSVAYSVASSDASSDAYSDAASENRMLGFSSYFLFAFVDVP